MRRVLAVAALLWAAFGLFLALWIVLPGLSWGIFLPILSWVISLLATEFSLLLAAYAVAGLGLATLCWRNGARRAAVVALAFGAATVALSLLPAAQAWRTARAEEVSLSLREYFAGPSFITDRSPNETRLYARPEGSEGEKLKLDVYEAGGRGAESAARSGSRPAVIMVHGGFFQFGRRSDTPRWDAWLADEGYMVFDIDYRLVPPPRWKDAPGDVKCAVGWAKENAESYGVDPDRIALMGQSAGGHLSLLAAYAEDNPRLPPSCETGDTSVAAVVSFYGPTDLTRLCPDVDDECALRPFTGATPATNPDRYRLVSPISHVDSSDPPTFLVQGGRDYFTPPEQSPLLARRLEEAGVEHRLLELPYAQHAFDQSWGGWGSQITRPELKRFLEQHLGRQSPKTR
jgi:acetyl esterase/lipase